MSDEPIDISDVQRPLSYKERRVQTRRVLESYIREVEMYRKEMKAMREQLNGLSSIVNAFFARERKL